MTTCTVCNEPLQLEHAGPVERSSGPVVAAAAALPYRSCATGHYRVDPTPGWGERAVRTTMETLTVARSRLLRADACAACGTPLTMPPFRSERAITVTAPTSTIRVSLPLVRCTECATENVPAELEHDLRQAVGSLLVTRGTTRDPRGA